MPRLFNRKYQKPVRQRLRNSATDAEKLLWSRLKHSQLLGYKFRRQQGIASYVVDFYCPEHKLAIEIDGVTHSTPEEVKHDKERQEYIERYGVNFLRFTNSDVFENLDWVLEAIVERLAKQTTDDPARNRCDGQADRSACLPALRIDRGRDKDCGGKMIAVKRMKTWKTLHKETVLQMGRFLTVEKHTVELPDGGIIRDWPWIIMPEYINVVPITEENEFLCFRQTKYAVEGTSLAPVGGFLEPGESPLNAAKRELLEEMGFESAEWIPIGRFSVDANRGAGTANFFIARHARKVAEPTKDDLEEQELVKFNQEELLAALRRGEFKSLGWASCVSLALLHLGSLPAK